MPDGATVELYFLRHAHAGDPASWAGPDDARPLSAKGEKQAERLGKFLASIGFRPDVIVASPKLRAKRTAEIVAGQLGLATSVDERLGGSLDPVAIEAILFDLGQPRRPVLVGHDPDFTDVVSALAGAHDIPMKKGALVRLDAVRPLSEGAGVLRWLVPPDVLPG